MARRSTDNGPVTINPAEAGARRLEHAGQPEQEGRLLVHRREAGQLVRAEGDRRHSAGPTTIYFMCAIHPWMHGYDHGPAGPELAARPVRPHLSPRLGRRAFLGALGGGALAALLPLDGRRQRRCCRSAASRRRRSPRCPSGRGCRSRAELTRLPTSRSRSARPRSRSCPAAKTRLWTYGGTFPGPTIRRPAGQRTEVTFHHQLPAAAGELTVHLHGGHNRTQFDGQPGGLTSVAADLLLLPHPARPLAARVRATTCCSSPAGEQNLRLRPDARTVVPNGPRSSGTTTTASTAPPAHVWRGLAGMWIVDDEFEDSLPLPRGRARHPADDRRPQLRPPQPAHRPLHRPAPAGRRDHRPPRSSSTAPTCPTTRSTPAATGCACSTSPRFRSLQPPPLQRRADDPDRAPTAA